MAQDVLEWGDHENEGDDAENEGEHRAEVSKNEEAGSNGTSSPSNESHDENSLGLVKGKVRRVPSWMQDYETGEGC